MSPEITLQEGAILLADAHYSTAHPAFFSFLKALDEGKITAPQLILMGDIFELLFGAIAQTRKDNEAEIKLLNTLSKKIEIIYFEGNHDFGLKGVFPGIRVYPLSEQPVSAQFLAQKIQLSHGDTKTPLGYQIYTRLIRTPSVLFTVGLIDRICGNCIIKWLKNRGEKKAPCYKIGAFQEIIKKRLDYLKGDDFDTVIEGHFHQDVSFELHRFVYINLAAFACNQKYFIVQSKKEQLQLQETRFEESE
jgi:UDP-2,3-diacylglucosamine hydrolase